MSTATAFRRRGCPGRLAIVLALTALAIVIQGSARPGAAADREPLSDAQAKASFILNVAKFVYWPKSSDATLVIGVMADADFATTVAGSVQGRRVHGRELAARHLVPGDDPAGCHVVFVAAGRAYDAAEMMRQIRGPVLTVGETAQFLRDGGVVRFYVENSKIRFQINQRNAQAIGLEVSSQLLSLAER